MNTSTKNALKNYIATMTFIIASTYFYTHLSPYHIRYFKAVVDINWANFAFNISAPEVFWGLVKIYAVFLLFYYGMRTSHRSNAAVVMDYFVERWHEWKWVPLTRTQSQALLKLMVKFYFIPLMVNWIMGHTNGVIHNAERLYIGTQEVDWIQILYSAPLFWIIFQMILFMDLFFFTVGYLVELPWLGNEIYSVEGTLFGWVICLACYPPFNTATGSFFAWQSQDFVIWKEHLSIQLCLNTLILVSFIIYAWASVALCWKASNLTNRGIVARGPYAWMRHPAYFTKNLAWWLGAIPALYVAAHTSFVQVMWILFCTGAWTTIYYFRALTEEWHLLSGNNGYAEYAQKVKYRFIPGIF